MLKNMWWLFLLQGWGEGWAGWRGQHHCPAFWNNCSLPVSFRLAPLLKVSIIKANTARAEAFTQQEGLSFF